MSMLTPLWLLPELARLLVRPTLNEHTLLCRYWTLKEAYAKAIGLGMSLAFDEIAFELHDGYGRLQTHSRSKCGMFEYANGRHDTDASARTGVRARRSFGRSAQP